MFSEINTLIFKVTRDCNLRCKYCYVKNKDNFKGEIVSFETFKDIINRVINDRKDMPKKNELNFVFHGGEPLLLGADKLKLYLGYASRKFLDNNIPCRFAMQTNLTLLSEDILMVLHEYNVNLGVSFDGIKEANWARSAQSTDYFEENFKLLKKYNISFGFLMVVHQLNYTKVKESVNYLINKYDIKSIKVNYAEDVLNLGGSEISGHTFFINAWKPLLDAFITGEHAELIESNLQNILNMHFRNIFSSEGHMRVFTGNCGQKICGGGKNIIEVGPDGKAHCCGRYSEDYEAAYIEHVNDKEFLNLRQLGKYFEMVTIKHKIINDLGCDLCIADGICDHGCMAFYYDKFGEFGIRQDLSCELFKDLINYFVLNEQKLLERLFDSKKNKDNTWYFNLGVRVNEKFLLNSARRFPEFNIGIDKKNKSGHNIFIKKKG